MLPSILVLLKTLDLRRELGPVHTRCRAPRNTSMQIIEHIVVNGSVKQHQRVCTQICMQMCLYVLCERALRRILPTFNTARALTMVGRHVGAVAPRHDGLGDHFRRRSRLGRPRLTRHARRTVRQPAAEAARQLRRMVLCGVRNQFSSQEDLILGAQHHSVPSPVLLFLFSRVLNTGTSNLTLPAGVCTPLSTPTYTTPTHPTRTVSRTVSLGSPAGSCTPPTLPQQGPVPHPPYPAGSCTPPTLPQQGPVPNPHYPNRVLYPTHHTPNMYCFS